MVDPQRIKEAHKHCGYAAKHCIVMESDSVILCVCVCVEMKCTKTVFYPVAVQML